MCEWVHIWNDIGGGQNIERPLEDFYGLKMRIYLQIFKISKNEIIFIFMWSPLLFN
jgi:hypothetical protein